MPQLQQQLEERFTYGTYRTWSAEHPCTPVRSGLKCRCWVELSSILNKRFPRLISYRVANHLRHRLVPQLKNTCCQEFSCSAISPPGNPTARN